MAPRPPATPNVYAISRDLWDHPAFADEPYTERQAWAWMIGAAVWKDCQTRGNSGPVDLKRAEISFSVRFLADKWKWSKSAVSRFLHKLEKRDMIRDTSRDNSQVYFIINYNRFQIVGLPRTERNGTDSGTGAGQERDKEETGKQVNKKKDSSALLFEAPTDFETWYGAYPRKIDRKDAERAYAKAVEKIDPPDLLTATLAFAKAAKFKDQKFIPHPATWLNKERWRQGPAEAEPLTTSFAARVREVLKEEPEKMIRNFTLTFGADLERAAAKLEEFASHKRPIVAASEYFFHYGAEGCTVGLFN